MTTTKAPTNRGRTAREIRESVAADFREWLADNEATLKEDGAVLSFRQPDTTVYAMEYRLDGRYLIVTGDMFEAIYEWSSPVSWEFLAGCDFSYFQGKLVAHAKGKHARQWNRDVLEHAVADRIPDHLSNLTTEIALQKMVEEKDPDGWVERPYIDDQRSWVSWLDEYGHDAFGDAWWEWAPSAGEVPDPTVVAHWVGLKMALEQVGEDNLP